MKRIFSLFLILSLSCKQSPKTDDIGLIQKAQSIHLETITLDTHDDINVENFTDSFNYTMDLDTQVNLPKMESGALDVAWFIVYTGQGDLSQEGYEKAAANAQAKFDAIHRLVTNYAPEKIALARTSAEVDSLDRLGKKIAMIGVENAYPIGEDLNEVKRYAELGARYMSLAHNGHNQFSDSNTGEFDNTTLHSGISELGKQLIDSLNYYGIMVDISHPSKESIRQTIQHSKAPVIASHSSARALSDHPRNLDDEQLEWVKNSGGVVQTVALGTFVNKVKQEKYQSAVDSVLKQTASDLGIEYLSRREQYSLPEEKRLVYQESWNTVQEEAKEALEIVKQITPPVNVSDFVDHIDYIKNKIGIDHVGISSDFDGGGGIEGWMDASQTFNITLELVKRGYSEEEIKKIWSGNLLRVLDRAQEISRDLQANN
ncbi:MAG: membrane dipeptidase [Bacteroidetes bacterium]|nr:membrane dipeptidase [Bacteroidota bacterium]